METSSKNAPNNVKGLKFHLDVAFWNYSSFDRVGMDRVSLAWLTNDYKANADHNFNCLLELNLPLYPPPVVKYFT